MLTSRDVNPLQKQQYYLPKVFCDICKEDDEKHLVTDPKAHNYMPRHLVLTRATRECLNCELALCQNHAEKHQDNERLKGHNIISYQKMLINGYSQIINAQKISDSHSV